MMRKFLQLQKIMKNFFPRMPMMIMFRMIIHELYVHSNGLSLLSEAEGHHWSSIFIFFIRAEHISVTENKEEFFPFFPNFFRSKKFSQNFF